MADMSPGGTWVSKQCARSGSIYPDWNCVRRFWAIDEKDPAGQTLENSSTKCKKAPQIWRLLIACFSEIALRIDTGRLSWSSCKRDNSNMTCSAPRKWQAIPIQENKNVMFQFKAKSQYRFNSCEPPACHHCCCAASLSTLLTCRILMTSPDSAHPYRWHPRSDIWAYHETSPTVPRT